MTPSLDGNLKVQVFYDFDFSYCSLFCGLDFYFFFIFFYFFFFFVTVFQDD